MLTDNLQDLDEGDVREVEKGLIKQINELNNTIQRIQVLKLNILAFYRKIFLLGSYTILMFLMQRFMSKIYYITFL